MKKKILKIALSKVQKVKKFIKKKETSSNSSDTEIKRSSTSPQINKVLKRFFAEKLIKNKDGP